MIDFFEAVLPQAQGWVPIITKDGLGNLKPTRWFHWPTEREEMEEYVRTKQGEDVYTSPMLYSEPPTRTNRSHAAKENVIAAAVVWADADEADPSVFKHTPSVQVETSPGKWHTYWQIIDSVDPELMEQMAHAVTLAHKADGVDNGWARSKRLRVPGTMNTKYDEPFRVRFKDNGIKYTVAEFAADYEPVESTVGEAGEMPEEVPDAYDVLNLIDFDPDLWSLFTDVPLSDYSSSLYRLEMDLFEQGLDEVQVFAVARRAACNKFERDGRPEEHLWQHVLATKAIFEEREDEEDLYIPAAEVDTSKKKDWSTLDLLEPEERAALPRTFIDEYADWAKGKSAKSARQYHEASAFCLLSVIFSEFGHLVPSWGNTPLNLYMLILGMTTKSRKSTSKNFMLKFIDAMSEEGSGYDYDAGSDVTPEGLTEFLTNKPGQSSLFWRDEVQDLFAAVRSGGYLRGLLAMVTEAYDGYVQGTLRKTGTTKRTRKTKTNLSFYGMGIVSQVAEVLTDDDFYSGFLPRTIIVIDDGAGDDYGSMDVTQQDDSGRGGERDDEFYRMLARLTRARTTWARLKERRGDSLPIRATDEAWKRWQVMTVQLDKLADSHPTRSEVLVPGAQRLGVTMLKCAALLAMLDESDEIEMHHMLTAIKYGTEWAKYMEQLASQVSKTAEARDLEELEELIAASAGPLNYSKALKHFKGRKTVREFNELIDFLVQSGVVKVDTKGNVKRLELRS